MTNLGLHYYYFKYNTKMIKYVLIIAITAACFVKLNIASFTQQLEYPGIQSGHTIANYTIKVDNPKEDEISVEGIWIKGRWINVAKEFSGNPITIRASVRHINTDTLSNKTPSPTKNNKDLGAIKFKIKGKSKARYIGIESITKEEPIARP